MNAENPASVTADEGLRRRYLLHRYWRSATGFWTGKRRYSAWMLSAALLFVILLVVGAAYAMNAWNRAIFDSLQDRDTAAVARLSLLYFAILAVSVLFGIAQVHFRMAIQRRWRAWLNDQLVDRWLSNGRYYQLNLVKGDHANPEYRIADDLRIATESPVDFVSGVTHALLSAATFMVVLWTIGGALDVTFAGIELHIPGFSRICRPRLRPTRERRHGLGRSQVRAGIGEQEPE